MLVSVAVSDHLNLVSLSSDNQLLFTHCVAHCFSTSGSLSTLPHHDITSFPTEPQSTECHNHCYVYECV